MAPKLTYFNGRGRAELSRLILAYADAKYDDKRIEFSEWPPLKADTPWGCLPTLALDDGTVISQSLAIARYLAREYGLNGKSNKEQSLADSVVEASVDLYAETYKFMFESDEKKKEEIKKKYIDTVAPGLLKNFENFLTKTSKSKNGYIVGDTITYADLALFRGVDTPLQYGVTLDKYPKVKAHRAKIAAEPKLAKYLKSRPDSQF